MTTPLDLAEEYFRAWLAADADGLRAVLAPHATFHGPLGTADDRESCVQGLLGMRAGVVSDLVVLGRLAGEDDVMTWFELHSEVAPPTPTVNWSHVSDGLIDRIRVTFDPRALLTGLQAREASAGEGVVTAFVLVPGACHGGWWYEPLMQALAARGHTAVALTLVGLEADPDVDRRTTLDTHVDQVAAAVRAAAAGTPDAGSPDAGGPVVLVAHSYAGTPCTAAADRHPDAVAALVLLDAFLPQDGDTCWAMTSDEQREWYVTGCARTGDGVEPLPSFDERARPHPVATLLQEVHLTGAWRDVPVRHYVSVPWPGESPLATSRQRAEADGGFVMHHWDTRHNVLHDGPDRVLRLLDDVLASVGQRRGGAGQGR